MPEAFILRMRWEQEMLSSLCRQRTRELNRKNFPSEVWFERMLFEHKIGGYQRNPALMNRYFGDFVWFSHNVVVEIDGKSHVGKEEYDKRRDQELTEYGYKVCRIKMGDWEHAMRVIERLKIVIKTPRQAPLPDVYFRKRRNKRKKYKAKAKQKHGKRKIAKCFTDGNSRIMGDLKRRQALWVHPRKRK